MLAISSWRRQWHPTPVLLPGKPHGRRSLVGCSPWGRNPGHAGREGPQLARTGASQGFPRAAAPVGVSLLGIHTEETRRQRDTCTPMFIAALTSPQWQPLSRKTPSEFSCVGRGEPVRKPSFPNWAGCCQRDLFLALTASRLLNRELHDWEEGADWESSV